MTGPGVSSPSQLDARIHDAIRRCWGFETLRPLQREAIEAGLSQTDSLVVMPTGGGKSLCYQVPPLLAQRLDVVVSPLISLMKDQVDGLRACGYPAAAIHSHLTSSERHAITQGLRRGEYRLLLVSPERLMKGEFLELLEALDIGAFAVDEAHCISHWGHDFRPEYRRLAMLKERFPGTSVHAFTATATPRVRNDIIEQLRLDDPNVLVGVFDRPNLVYRVLPRTNAPLQVADVLRRHRNEAAIVYCMTRVQTEKLAASLTGQGIKAEAYHAGMEAAARGRTQDAFASESLDVVVATVAFGMGIDRSNVRCVVHATMPQSVEHYQQETGRAGRDGLEAECVLLYSGEDVFRWRSIIERNDDDEPTDEHIRTARREILWHMQNLCRGLECRHRALSRYFGQPYERDGCDACDVCLGEVQGMPDSTVTAQKILSCIARVGQSFGIGHVVRVLRGASAEQVTRWEHDRVSTFGLLRDMSDRKVTNLVYQLVDHGLLERTEGDRPLVRLNQRSIEVLRGERQVQLVDPEQGSVRKTRAATESWEGVDRELFERLRALRRRLAGERGVPAYVIFGDATLRELAHLRPTTLEVMADVRGVGSKKLADLGPVFTEAIRSFLAGRDT
ncbi:MAG: DNA helicase RecQ [Planctomycetes bacterium]|nr:DNA helicase RecQ [Planctomycetota bacterium]